MRYQSSPDLISYCFERGLGLFSIQSEEAFEKRLKVMHESLVRDGINSYHIPESLKNLAKRFAQPQKRCNAKVFPKTLTGTPSK